MKRHKMNKRNSKRLFSKKAKVNARNNINPMRGGIRL